MSATKYVRCPNPSCSKSNPIHAGEADKEHFCIFCGTPLEAPEQQGNEKEVSNKKRNRGKRAYIDQSQKKPVNRNTRKELCFC